MKRKPNYFEMGIKIAIVVLFIAVIVIAAINMFGPSSSEIQILGVAVDVPEGSFDPDSVYQVYSTYVGKDGGWSITAINFDNYNSSDSKQNNFVNTYDSTKFSDLLYSEKHTVDGITIYTSGGNAVSYFKVDSVDFKVSGDQETVLFIVKSIKDLNKDSNITFS